MDRHLKLVSKAGTSSDLYDPVLALEGHVSEQALRIAEALLFASATPLSAEAIAEALPQPVHVTDVLAKLSERYAERGVNLVQAAEGYAFRTAADLAFLVARDREEPRKLGRAALEILAIIAYHQPVTRAEIEDIRGVATSKGTLDFLLESGWVRMRGRRRTPGRPVTYGTTMTFLDHFNLNKVSDLPGLEELKGAGFIEGKLAAGLFIPSPSDDAALQADEDELQADIYDKMQEERLETSDAELDPDDGKPLLN